MKTIYIVKGATSEYSDFHQWDVRAFTSKVMAEMFVKGIEAIIKDLCNDKTACMVPYEMIAKIESELRDVDPNISIDRYTGITYSVSELILDSPDSREDSEGYRFSKSSDFS
jgi:hypothetical protein